MPNSKRLSFKDVTLSQLRSFREVCRLGGYAAAAREVLLTTPAVWEQVQALERHYGRPLVERQGQGIAPTAEGSRLLEMIQPLLAGLDSARHVLQQQDGELPARLTVATNLRVLAEEISRAMRQFQMRHPQVQLQIIYTGNDVDERVAHGQADVGFTLEPRAGDQASSAVEYEAAGAVDYLLITPPRHSLLARRPLQLKQIIKHALILGIAPSYSRGRVQEVLQRYDLADTLVVAAETSSDEYTLSCVRAGLGVGVTIGTGKGHLYRGLGVRSLRKWFGTARVGFLWKKGAFVPPVQRAMADAIRACAQQRF
jgi:molybdate transport repressor ModE-like protein